MKHLSLRACLVAFVISLLFSGCYYSLSAVPVGGGEEELPSSTIVTTTQITTAPEPEIPEAEVVRIIAAGDNLVHSALYNQAYRYAQEQGKEGYDPTYQYELIAKYIPLGDISIVNQETPLSGDVYPPENYPTFSTPTEYGEHMVKLGFDVFSHANNHILDQGEGGAIATMDFWDTIDEATVVGVYRDEEDRDNIRTVEANGLTFSFLGFTFSTNGLSLPEDSDVQVIYTDDEALMQEQISRARSISDVVVVNVHWGEEGLLEPHFGQTGLAQNFADWGADIILGTHPHVLQPIEYLTAADGREVLCFYSLGNLISSQNLAAPMAGALFDFTVTREYDEDGSPLPITIGDINVMPIVTHYEENVSNLHIIPFKDYTPELAAQHGLISYWDVPFSYETVKNIYDTVIPAEYLVDELE